MHITKCFKFKLIRPTPKSKIDLKNHQLSPIVTTKHFIWCM